MISKTKWNSFERIKKGFKDLVCTIPRTMNFEEAWEKHALEFYLIDEEDTKKNVEDDFIDIRLDLYPPASSETIKGWVQEYDRKKERRSLYKIENPGRFLITIVIK